MITAIIPNIRRRLRRITMICKASHSSPGDDVGWALGCVPGRPGFESRPSQILVACLWANQAEPQLPQL